MPSLGADMEAGTLVEWLVKPGNRVKRGDIVAVVETQKGAIEIEIFETGLIEQILVEVNSKVPVGTPLARIQTELEAGIAAPPTAIAAAPSAPPPTPTPAPPRPVIPSAAHRVRVSPAARRLAETRGVDLATVTGSGPAGAIVRGDVERSPGAAMPPPEKKRPIGLDLDAM
jgi:pyruvate dehydrogenase E2 component (dihydrolipoamide acetyltransferase)